MKMSFRALFPVFVGLALLAGCSGNGCKGEQGLTGPSGPAGTPGAPGTPPANTYLYSNNFDSVSNLNEWAAFGGVVTGGLDTTAYLSSPKSAKFSITSQPADTIITAAVNYTSGVVTCLFEANLSGV